MQNYYFIDEQYVPEAVKKVNELHKWANKAILKLLPIIKQARLIKHDTALSAKDKQLVEPILKTAPFRACISVNNYGPLTSTSIWLNADIHYPVSEHGCKYAKIEFYLGQNENQIQFKPYPIYTAKQVLKDIAKYKQVANTARLAIDRADNLGFKLKAFKTN